MAHLLPLLLGILEAVGVYLLYREVGLAQRFEGVLEQMDYEVDLLKLLHAGNLREAYIKDRMWFGLSEDVATQYANLAASAPGILEDWARISLANAASPNRVREVKTKLSRDVEHRRRRLLLGAWMVILAVLLDGFASFREHGDAQIATTSTMTLFPAPVIRFAVADSRLGVVGVDSGAVRSSPICKAKQALIARNAETAIVVGRHDQSQLRDSARAAFSTNLGLAQRRAEEVAQFLLANNDCGKGLQFVLRLAGAPTRVGAHIVADAMLAPDRVAEVYGIAGGPKE